MGKRRKRLGKLARQQIRNGREMERIVTTMVADPTDSSAVRLGEKGGSKAIEYPDGTHQFTKDRVEAIAWATYRRGRVKWEGRNLPNQIATYLTELGYPMRNEDARYIIEWVAKHKYGYATLAEVGNGERKRYVEFNFFRNYDISKCSPKGLLDHDRRGKPVDVSVNGKAPAPIALVHETGVVEVSDPIEHLRMRAEEDKARMQEAAKPAVVPPMPFEPPKPRPYLLDELDEKLIAWADADPEAYAKWIDAVLESFGYASS